MMGVSDPGCSVTLPSRSNNNNPDKGATKRSPGTQVAMEGGVARQSLSHMPTRPFPFRLAEQCVFAHDTHISDRVIGSSLPRQVSHGSRARSGKHSFFFFWVTNYTDTLSFRSGSIPIPVEACLPASSRTVSSWDVYCPSTVRAW